MSLSIYSTLYSLQSTRFIILLIYILITFISLFYGSKFSSSCVGQINLPKSSDEHRFNNELISSFGSTSQYVTCFYLFYSKDKQPIIRPLVENTIDYIISNITISEYKDVFVSPLSYYTYKDIPTLQASIKKQMVSEDGLTMILTYQMNMIGDTTDIANFQLYIKNLMLSTVLQNGNYGIDLQTTGSVVLENDVKLAASKDLKNLLYLIPFIIVILILSLQSWRLLIIPCVTFIISTALSFCIMYVVSTISPLISFTPTIMMVIILSYTLHHSMFILNRFRSELHLLNFDDAVYATFDSAGKTVIMSSLTLIIGFCSLIIFPFNFIRDIGIGSAVAMTITLIVNISFVPCCLLTFNDFFGVVSKPYCQMQFIRSCISSFCNDDDEEDDHYPIAVDKSSFAAPIASHNRRPSLNEATFTPISNSVWYWLTQFIIKTRLRAFVVFIAVIGASFPLIIQCQNFHLTMDASQMYPTDSESWQALDQFTLAFPPGQLSPFKILLANKKSSDIGGALTSAAFDLSHSIINELINSNLVSQNDFQSISFIINPINNKPIYVTEATFKFFYEISQPFKFLYSRVINYNNASALIVFKAPFMPLSDNATQYVSQVHNIIKQYQNNTNFNVHFGGPSVELVEVMNITMSYFPNVVISTAITLAIIGGFFMLSLIYPLRLLFTIAYPMSFIYGALWLIFSPNSSAGEFFNLQTRGGIYWLAFVLTFPMIIGLGVDYDLFLFSRIREYRLVKAVSLRSSIVLAMSHTGGTISSVSLVMALCFGVLLFSSTIMLKELGFIIMSFIVIDAFIVRTILVPSIVRLIGDINFFPMTPEKRHEPRFIQVNEQDEDE